MYIAKVKMVAAIAAAVIVTGTAVPVGIVVAQAAEAALAHSALEKMGSRSPDADHMPLAGKAAELEDLLPGLESPSVIPLAREGMIAIHAVVGADEVWGLLPRLKAAGASGILVLPIEKVLP